MFAQPLKIPDSNLRTLALHSGHLQNKIFSRKTVAYEHDSFKMDYFPEAYDPVSMQRLNWMSSQSLTNV